MPACSYGIGAFYGPFGDIADEAGCEAQFRNAFLMGCTGAWSLAPSQIAIAKRVFSPDAEEVLFAKRILEAMPDGSGVAMIDGKMQDDATWKQAKVMVDLARLVAQAGPRTGRSLRILGRAVVSTNRRPSGAPQRLAGSMSIKPIRQLLRGLPSRPGDRSCHAAHRHRGRRGGVHGAVGPRFALNSSADVRRTRSASISAPIDDLLAFHLVFGKTVPDISLNALANLGYAGGRSAARLSGRHASTTSTVIGLKQNSNGKTGVV